MALATDRHRREEVFHDDWAANMDTSLIDVIKRNESVTAPEMRYITERLGPLGGKKLVDLGCGLGEAGVYFAIKGADVTSVDISDGMLSSTHKLAERYNVRIRTVKSSIDELSVEGRFDIAYAGNLFHHVDIESTIRRFAEILNDDGLLVSWDPVAYNPLVNIYRLVAKRVRTSDEHPLTVRDVKLFKKYFSDVEVRYFWFSTLLVFVFMVLVQLRDPNKERFWKVVVDEGDRWAWMYKPLEAFDRLILRLFPFLGPLCWNVVVIASRKISRLPTNDKGSPK